MRLFLSSAGLPPETTEEFLKLLKKEPKGMRTCLITTACYPKKNEWYVRKDKERLEELGFEVEEFDLKDKDKDFLREELKNFDVIFVEGGNTFYLLKCVRESGFAKALKEFLDKGGVYLGVSAGSIIMGPNIESANQDKNIINLKDLTGLKIVPFVIFVHLEKKDIKKIKEYADKTNYPVIALSDKQAILIDGETKRIVGSGEKHTFNISEKF